MAAALTGNQSLSKSTVVDDASVDVEDYISHKTVSHVNGLAPDTASVANGVPKPISYPKSRVQIVDRFLDEPRKLRVAVIGGGLAGIISGCLLPAKVPGIELVIYEKNPEFVSLTGRTQCPCCLNRHWTKQLLIHFCHNKGRDMVRERVSRYVMVR